MTANLDNKYVECLNPLYIGSNRNKAKAEKEIAERGLNPLYIGSNRNWVADKKTFSGNKSQSPLYRVKS